MSNVTHATFCKFCETEILPTAKGLPDRCPECFRIILKPDNKYFDTPEYISTQRKELEAELEESKIVQGSYDHHDALIEIQKAEDDWFRVCSLFEDKDAALTDALLYIAHLPYSRLTRQQAEVLLSKASKIGSMAESIRLLYKSGVSLYDREIRSIRSGHGDTESSQAAASASRGT